MEASSSNAIIWVTPGDLLCQGGSGVRSKWCPKQDNARGDSGSLSSCPCGYTYGVTFLACCMQEHENSFGNWAQCGVEVQLNLWTAQ